MSTDSLIYQTIQKQLIKNRPRLIGFPWERFFYWVVSFLIYLAISAVAIGFALGYRVNWTALSLVQTGLIQIDSQVNGKDTKVYLNNKLVSEKIPTRLNGVFPGTYTVKIIKEGYQSYEQNIVLEQNQRIVFEDILLLKTNPDSISTDGISNYDARFQERNGEKLEIRGGNEIWARDKYVTRASMDIGSLQWFPDKLHLVVQLGDEIRLMDVDGKHSQLIVRLSTTQPVPYFFTNSGQNFYYLEKGQVKGLVIYQSLSFVERIGYTP